MPRDANGNYVRPTNSFSNPVPQTVINSTDADTLFDDFETALNNSAEKNPQYVVATATAMLPNERVLTAGAGITLANAATTITVSADLSSVQPLDADLTALAALTGTNTIYYRSAANTWSPVTIDTNTMDFTGGLLKSTAGFGNVVSVPTPVNGQLARWTSATQIEGIVGSHGDLMYRGASGWVTLPAGIPGQILQTQGTAGDPTWITAAGGGNVSNVGIPTTGQLARWTDTTHIEGVSLATAGVQPLDADLTSIASYNATGSWLYRSGADTWSPVTFGTGITFSGGAISVTANTYVLRAGDTMTGALTINPSSGVNSLNLGHAAALFNHRQEIHGTTGAIQSTTCWSTSASGQFPTFNLIRSAGAAIGTWTAVTASDVLGALEFRGTTGTAGVINKGAHIQATATGGPVGGSSLLPTTLGFSTVNAAGTLGEKVRIGTEGALMVGSAITAPGDVIGSAVISPRVHIRQNVDSGNAGLAIVTVDATHYTLMFQATGGPLRFEAGGAGSGFQFFRSGDTTTPIVNITSANGTFLKGTTTNDAASAGYVGQYLSVETSSVSAAASTNTTIATLNLTAGDWDVYSEADIVGPAAANYYYSLSLTGGNVIWCMAIPSITNTGQTRTRASLASTTAINLIINPNTTGNATCGGRIYARRRR